jgi:hypothetical protein
MHRSLAAGVEEAIDAVEPLVPELEKTVGVVKAIPPTFIASTKHSVLHELEKAIDSPKEPPVYVDVARANQSSVSSWTSLDDTFANAHEAPAVVVETVVAVGVVPMAAQNPST